MPLSRFSHSQAARRAGHGDIRRIVCLRGVRITQSSNESSSQAAAGHQRRGAGNAGFGGVESSVNSNAKLGQKRGQV